MIFLIFTILIICLQLLNNRLLRKILHPKLTNWVTGILITIHLPLIVYASTRLIGASSNINWLRVLAQIGILFQLLTVMLLSTCAITNIIWRWTKRLQKADQKSFTSVKHRKYLQITSVVGICLAIYCAAHGVMKAKSEPEIIRFELKLPNLPTGLDGLRIVQISDLHSGPMVHPKQLKHWRYLIEKEQPELLLITGDIVDSLPTEVRAAADAFRNFHAPLGCFAILGNHDYFTNPSPIWNALSDVGIKILENSSALVTRNGDQLAILGLQDPIAGHKRLFKGKPYGCGPQPDIAAQDIPKNIWRICMSHRPSDWPLAKKTGAVLTLSGHTHGGQVNFIPGISSALLLGKQYTHGLYKEGPYYLYVNRGLGVVGLPIRINSQPEITVITFRRG